MTYASRMAAGVLMLVTVVFAGVAPAQTTSISAEYIGTLYAPA